MWTAYRIAMIDCRIAKEMFPVFANLETSLMEIMVSKSRMANKIIMPFQQDFVVTKALPFIHILGMRDNLQSGPE